MEFPVCIIYIYKQNSTMASLLNMRSWSGLAEFFLLNSVTV